MEHKRKGERLAVDLAVTLTTVLESIDARIVDLSGSGARIADAALPEGRQFQIEYLGQTIYAKCMWSEVDRMGASFPFGIGDGPLRDALVIAALGPSTPPAARAVQTEEALVLPGTFPARWPAFGFGRRSFS